MLWFLRCFTRSLKVGHKMDSFGVLKNDKSVLALYHYLKSKRCIDCVKPLASILKSITSSLKVVHTLRAWEMEKMNSDDLSIVMDCCYYFVNEFKWNVINSLVNGLTNAYIWCTNCFDFFPNKEKLILFFFTIIIIIIHIPRCILMKTRTCMFQFRCNRYCIIMNDKLYHILLWYLWNNKIVNFSCWNQFQRVINKLGLL